MSLDFQILGKPGRDNGLFLKINGGSSYYRLLFDCGENILQDLKQSEIKAIDYLFLSHLHIDHIAGFDYYFRRNFDAENKSFFIWGPERTAEIIHHRFLGFNWNLIAEQGSSWYVNEINEKNIHSFLFKSSEGFSGKYDLNRKSYSKIIFENNDFIIEAEILNHRIPSVGYRVSEKDSININKNALHDLNFSAGKWIEKLKDFSIKNSEKIIINKEEFSVGDLREKLIIKTNGESIAYLTDFKFNEDSGKTVINFIKNCDTVICESQYSVKDENLAKRNYHLTTKQAAFLGKEAGVKKLILFHISDRYKTDEYNMLLSEARDVFEETYLPEGWNLK